MIKHWCANTVRIQAAPHNLFSSTSSLRNVNMAYLRALRAEVAFAQGLGLTVIVTAQTEHVGQVEHGVPQLAPTAITLRYWLKLGHVFRGNDGIMFDLFNEPRLMADGTRKTWSLWRNGGRHDGAFYLGMQNLVRALRRAGIERAFLVEGPYYGGTLAAVTDHPLAGSDIVYAVHHPIGAHDPAVWASDFGRLARRHAVIEGEWSQYASMRPECWPDARTQVSIFLSYLKRKRIGLVAWTLRAGVLIRASGKWNDPTRLLPGYSCTNGLDQGAGHLIQQYFYANNGR